MKDPLKRGELRDFVRDCRGSMVEIVLVIGLVAVLALGAYRLFGKSLRCMVLGQSGAVAQIGESGTAFEQCEEAAAPTPPPAPAAPAPAPAPTVREKRRD